MLKFTIGLIIIYKFELIADKDQNNTYVFTNIRVNLYQVIYSKICDYISIVLIFISNQLNFIYYCQTNGEFQHE